MIHVGSPEFKLPPQSLVEPFSRPAHRGGAVRGHGRFGLVEHSLHSSQPVLIVSWLLTEDQPIHEHSSRLAEMVDWTPTPCTCAAAWTKTGLNYYRVSLPSLIVQEWIRMYPLEKGHSLAHRLLPRRRAGDIRWQSPLHIVLTVELHKRNGSCH